MTELELLLIEYQEQLMLVKRRLASCNENQVEKLTKLVYEIEHDIYELEKHISLE